MISVSPSPFSVFLMDFGLRKLLLPFHGDESGRWQEAHVLAGRTKFLRACWSPCLSPLSVLVNRTQETAPGLIP